MSIPPTNSAVKRGIITGTIGGLIIMAGGAVTQELQSHNTDKPHTQSSSIIEHDCTVPTQCEKLAKRFPNDDVILTTQHNLQNCITTGNHKCPKSYRMVDDLPHWRFWYNAIKSEHNGYDPYRCLVKIADTSVIVCQDGWMTTS